MVMALRRLAPTSGITVNVAEAMLVLPEMLVANSLMLSRGNFFNQDVIDPQGRNLDKECGYPEGEIPLQAFDKQYKRGGIAARVTNLFSDECWSTHPELYEIEDANETAFEKKWKQINKKINCWHYLHRIDRLSGIGHFGILLLGFSDGGKLKDPVRLPGEGEKPLELMFMRCYSESHVTIGSYETNDKSPRYGQVNTYSISTGNSELDSVEGVGKSADENITEVHWTRVIHVADNRMESETHGIPRMQQVYNYLFDVRKVGGGSGEMFWRGAFPGYSFETFPEFSNEADIDEESVKEQFRLWSNGLQRYMALQGMTAKSLAPQVADPTNHLTQLLTLICATIGCPLRVFLGSESGQLASGQDVVAWNSRLALRQADYITPFIIEPFIHRLMDYGILPRVEEFSVAWFDLNSLKDTDKADIGVKRTQALLQYVTSGAETVVPFREFLINFMLFTPKEADAMVRAQMRPRKMATKRVWQQDTVPQSKNPAKKTGASGNRNAQKKR